LRPSLLDDLGLVAALRWYVDRQAQWGNFTAEFIADTIETRLPPDMETVCFRVTQEAVTNVVRHAQATKVRIELKQQDDEVSLNIQDDGVGFNVRAAEEHAVRGSSLGLLGMKERVLLAGGKFEIRSQPHSGTEIRVYFPIPDRQPRVLGC
jgi:signal transduction histidine kinase